jgi:hypothetical protein
MNLENLNLVELNAQEVENTDGGLFGFDDVAYAALCFIGAGIVNNWSDIKHGAHDAWNQF